MFFSHGINALASRQKILFEKIRKAVNSVFCIIYRRVERGDILNLTLNFWMIWQAVEKADPALGTFDGHLRPKARRVGIRTAEVGDALLDQAGCSTQTA